MHAHLDPARVSRLLADVPLRIGPGTGDGATVDVCAVQAADWIAGGQGRSETPACVDPVVRGFILRLNDANGFAVWRDELKPHVVRSVNTEAGQDATVRRAFMVADWAVRTGAPKAFEVQGHPELGAQLRAIPPIVDPMSARRACLLARAVRLTISMIAAASADAAAYAAVGDPIASAASEAAAAAAAYVPIFAAAQARNTAGARELWLTSLAMLVTLIELTEGRAAADR